MRYDNVTFMMCFPRSRSAWLSTFLKPVAWTMHDPLKACESISELRCKIDDVMKNREDQPIFVADTAAVLFAPDLGKFFPNAKYLFVDRPIDSCIESLTRQGMMLPTGFRSAYIDAYDLALHTARARRDLVLRVGYDDLDKRLLNVWRFVGDGRLLSPEYAERMIATNIQIPFEEQMAATDRRKTVRLFSSIGLRL